MADTTGLPVRPPPESSLESVVRREALALTEEAEGCWDDLVALAARAARVEAILDDFRLVERTVKMRAGELMEQRRARTFTMEGLAQVTIGSGWERTAWRHLELAQALVRAAALRSTPKRDRGELPDGLEAAGIIVPAAGIMWWNADVVTNHGLDVDDYCARGRLPWIRVSDNRLRSGT